MDAAPHEETGPVLIQYGERPATSVTRVAPVRSEAIQRTRFRPAVHRAHGPFLLPDPTPSGKSGRSHAVDLIEARQGPPPAA